MAYIYQMPVDEVVQEGQTRHVDHLLILYKTLKSPVGRVV